MELPSIEKVIVRNTFIEFVDDEPSELLSGFTVPKRGWTVPPTLPSAALTSSDSRYEEDAPAEGTETPLGTYAAVSGDADIYPEGMTPTRIMQIETEENLTHWENDQKVAPQGMVMCIPRPLNSAPMDLAPMNLHPQIIGMGRAEDAPPGCVLIPVGILPGAAPAPAPLAPVPVSPEVVTVAPIAVPIADSSDSSAPLAPLRRSVSRSSSIERVFWSVGARKLTDSNRSITSPPFNIDVDGQNATFKIILYAEAEKGGFKKADGQGQVQLKCDAGSATISFKIGVNSGNATSDAETYQPSRGPVTHNFALNAVGALPKDVAVWDFNRSVNAVSNTFVVVVEFLPNLQ